MTNRRNKRRRASRNAALDIPAFYSRALSKFYVKPISDFLNGNIHIKQIRRIKRRNYLETGSATRWRRIPPGRDIWYLLSLRRAERN